MVTNYTLLDLIIESLTNNAAEGEIRCRILEVLGLEHTFVDRFDEPMVSNTMPHRYHLANPTFHETSGVCPAFPVIQEDLVDLVDATGSNLSVSWLAGGMVSTTSDLLKFALALRDGKLLKSASTRIMQQGRPATPNSEMGHGLFRMTVLGKGTWLSHSGGVLGFSSGLWWQEDRNCVVCVLENVGTVHTGNAMSGVKRVIRGSNFLVMASQLTCY